ncbi:hypothetical protein BGX23_001398 [Mortierella sp. AD031]|nr:hypothetical protein BGX23_001398 [Mortierella sp. AD031]
MDAIQSSSPTTTTVAHPTSPSTIVILPPSTNAMKQDMVLQILELLSLVGSFLPLFERHSEPGHQRLVDV